MNARWLIPTLLLTACAAAPPTRPAPIARASPPSLETPALAASELPAPDDYAEALHGPYADLEAYCAEVSSANPSWRCDTESELVTGPSRTAGDGAVQEARIVGRGDDEGFMECALAVKTARGWFVAKTAPICNGAGSARIWLEVEAFEARGPRVAVRWVEVDSHSFDSNEGWLLEESRRSERVSCAVRPDGVPACSFAVVSNRRETEAL